MPYHLVLDLRLFADKCYHIFMPNFNMSETLSDEKMARGEAKSCLRTELLMQGDALAEELDVLSVTMLGAGVGPSAAGLHWGLALLAVRHDIQQKAYDELRRYTAMEPSMNVMNNLHDSAGCPYVHALAQEILR